MTYNQRDKVHKYLESGISYGQNDQPLVAASRYNDGKVGFYVDGNQIIIEKEDKLTKIVKNESKRLEKNKK